MHVFIMLCSYNKDFNKLVVIKTSSAQGQFSLYCLASKDNVHCIAAAVYKFQADGIIEVLVNLTEKIEGNAMSTLAIVKAAGAQVAACKSDATADTEYKLPFEAGTVTVKRVAILFQTGNVSIPVNVVISVYTTAKDQQDDFVVCLAVKFMYIFDTGVANSEFEEAVNKVNSVNHKWAYIGLWLA